MIDLYYWPTPNGHKIPIMLEECGLAYTTHPINMLKGDQFDPAYLTIKFPRSWIWMAQAASPTRCSSQARF
jgi:glutathione S-transferase